MLRPSPNRTVRGLMLDPRMADRDFVVTPLGRRLRRSGYWHWVSACLARSLFEPVLAVLLVLGICSVRSSLLVGVGAKTFVLTVSSFSTLKHPA